MEAKPIASSEIGEKKASLDGRADLRDLAALRALQDACFAQNHAWQVGGTDVVGLTGGSILCYWVLAREMTCSCENQGSMSFAR